MQPLTKKHIQKLLAAPVDVSLWNGTFNRVVVEAICNQRKFRIEVDVTHPLLLWNRSTHEQFKIKIIDNHAVYSDTDINLQKEIQDIIENMVNTGKMSDEMAQGLSLILKDSYQEFCKEMGII